MGQDVQERKTLGRLERKLWGLVMALAGRTGKSALMQIERCKPCKNGNVNHLPALYSVVLPLYVRRLPAFTSVTGEN